MQKHAAKHKHEHEETDVNVKGIAWTAFGLLLTVVFGLVGGYFTFIYFADVQNKCDKPLPAMCEGRVFPPEPRLQTSNGGDLVKMRAKDKQILENYGVDPKTGTVRIPIERAMELTAQRGLPFKEEQKK